MVGKKGSGIQELVVGFVKEKQFLQSHERKGTGNGMHRKFRKKK